MLPMKPVEVAANGNAEVVAMLKQWLERAEQGRIAFAGIVACEHPLHAVTDHRGSLQLMFAANWGLDTLKMLMQEKMASRHLVPEPAQFVGNADRVCFDVTNGPACFDFIAWLVIAEMNRRRAGAPAPLKVGFKMVDSPEEHERHARLRQKMYDNVILPALAFVGAVEDDASCDAPVLDRYTIGPVVEFAKAGEEVPVLKASENATKAIEAYLQDVTKGQAPITITLREAAYWEYRNSNLSEWIKVAEHLESQGERVIFVRDTAKWDEPIDGFEICPPASVDLDIRLALYEAAKCNLAVSNGPWMLMLHGTAPWLMFVEPNPMSPFFPETPQFWTQWHGINPGLNEQFPWSKESQRVIWQRDNADNVIAAWEKLKPLLAQPVREAAE